MKVGSDLCRMMYSPIIDGYAELGDGDEAAAWLSRAEQEGQATSFDRLMFCSSLQCLQGVKPNIVMYNASAQMLCISVSFLSVSSSQSKFVQKFDQSCYRLFWQTTGVCHSCSSTKAVVKGYCRQRNLDAAKEWLHRTTVVALSYLRCKGFEGLCSLVFFGDCRGCWV